MVQEIYLLYGLYKSRKKSHDVLSTQITDHNGPIYMDSYNNRLLFDLVLSDNNKVYDIPKLLDTRALDWKNYIREDSSSWPLWNNYYRETQKNEKFRFKYLADRVTKESEHLNTTTMNRLAENHFKKNGCKIGIELAKKMPHVYIYFILDDLSILKVIKKENSFTGSELRYIYRNRHELNDKIIYIKNGIEVKAPWIENPEIWQAYIPKNERQKNNFNSLNTFEELKIR